MGAASHLSNEETLSIASLSIAESKPSAEEPVASATNVTPAPENVRRIEQLEDEMERATTLYLDRSKAVHAAAAALRATMVELTHALEQEGVKLDRRMARVLKCAELLGVDQAPSELVKSPQEGADRGVFGAQNNLKRAPRTECVISDDLLTAAGRGFLLQMSRNLT